MSRGGRRPGAGRKPKTALERAISPGHHGRVLTHPGAGVVPIVAAIEPVDAPDTLTSDEGAVWLLLAPHASAARTLTPGTAFSFGLLCRNVVLERALATDAGTRGGSSHRGLIQRVDAELLRFNLSPCGKAIYQAEPEAKPINPLDRFLNRDRSRA